MVAGKLKGLRSRIWNITVQQWTMEQLINEQLPLLLTKRRIKLRIYPK
ncbi:hypothetical protein CWATWH8502_3350 [Crocosphaera watsonii WH 8502]|uniref:Uncharacterized protein n=1 Tax=Crocosphaera watsonii WH 8502 TaxID=423474 RepID=T2I6S5_CROWT|nr:hypothetical protein CWATWH8502_3350 [Crocosphaera watsonii WH 8502]